MVDNLSTSSSEDYRGVPLAAIVTIILVIIVEVCLYNSRIALLPGVFIISEDKREVLQHGEDHEILIMGDSRLFHMKPSVVEEVFGNERQAVNLNWPFFGVEANVYFLEEYLSIHKKPDFLILDFMPNHVAFPEEVVRIPNRPIVTNRMYILLSFKTVVSNLVKDGRWDLLWDYSKYLCTPPSLKFRERIQWHLTALRKTGAFHKLPDNDMRQIEEFRRDGAFVIFDDEVYTQEDMDMLNKGYGPFKLYENPSVIEYFERFLDLAQEEGIVVVMINPPETEAINELYKEHNISDAMETIVSRWEAEYENLIVLRPLVHSLPNDNFGDTVHMNKAGIAIHEPMYRRQLEEARPRIEEMVEKLKESE